MIGEFHGNRDGSGAIHVFAIVDIDLPRILNKDEEDREHDKSGSAEREKRRERTGLPSRVWHCVFRSLFNFARFSARVAGVEDATDTCREVRLAAIIGRRSAKINNSQIVRRRRMPRRIQMTKD